MQETILSYVKKEYPKYTTPTVSHVDKLLIYQDKLEDIYRELTILMLDDEESEEHIYKLLEVSSHGYWLASNLYTTLLTDTSKYLDHLASNSYNIYELYVNIFEVEKICPTLEYSRKAIAVMMTYMTMVSGASRPYVEIYRVMLDLLKEANIQSANNNLVEYNHVLDKLRIQAYKLALMPNKCNDVDSRVTRLVNFMSTIDDEFRFTLDLPVLESKVLHLFNVK